MKNLIALSLCGFGLLNEGKETVAMCVVESIPS
jgi:hypothetical protein